MAIFFLLYVAIGVALGFAWNRAEFGRANWRRIALSFGAFLLAWPGLVACVCAVAVIWTHIWRRAHAADTKAVEIRAPVPAARSLATPELSHPV